VELYNFSPIVAKPRNQKVTKEDTLFLTLTNYPGTTEYDQREQGRQHGTYEVTKKLQ
jgi:hypothetical protein